MAVIEANPAQSKHLATATMRLEGFSLDFVNLRSETYSSSRIPDKIEFGTPLQDAERRDFTINSLFYNLNTKQVDLAQADLGSNVAFGRFCRELPYVLCCPSSPYFIGQE